MLFIILHSSKNSAFKDFPSSRECLWQETRKEPDLQKDSRRGPHGARGPQGNGPVSRWEQEKPGSFLTSPQRTQMEIFDLQHKRFINYHLNI